METPDFRSVTRRRKRVGTQSYPRQKHNKRNLMKRAAIVQITWIPDHRFLYFVAYISHFLYLEIEHKIYRCKIASYFISLA